MPTPQAPYFRNAPVVERVLGVQFDSVSGFHNGLLGAFWKSLGDDWPQVTDAGPIEPEFEQFGESALWAYPGVSFRVSQSPGCRLQIQNAAGDRMIQVQNCRFHLNWKGTSGEGYPRFPAIQDEFLAYLKRFRDFLASDAKAGLRPNTWEVTYVNHCQKGTVWKTPEDWQSVFSPLVLPRPTTAFAALETLGGNWQYEIQPRRGRLRVELRHGRQDDRELLAFTLTARGPLGQTDDASIAAGLDLGRQTIDVAFKELTSDAAHKYWELENA